jgi:hypothetical protein
MAAEIAVRGRADMLRYAAEVGMAALAPVRERDTGEFATAAYGELGLALGRAVFALGVGAGYADEDDAGMVTLEPSLQHVTAGSERAFVKLVIALVRSDVTAQTPTPDWSVQLGARF